MLISRDSKGYKDNLKMSKPHEQPLDTVTQSFKAGNMKFECK